MKKISALEKDVALLKEKVDRLDTLYKTIVTLLITGVVSGLIQLIHKYNIPIKKDYTFMFNISNEALNSEPGIYSHVSYRTDKSDCYPDNNLIKMLNSLWEKI